MEMGYDADRSGDIVTDLPDVTGMTLDQLLTSDDPAIVAAAARVAADALRPAEVEVTYWP